LPIRATAGAKIGMTFMECAGGAQARRSARAWQSAGGSKRRTETMNSTQTSESVHPAHTLFGRMADYDQPVLIRKIQTDTGLDPQQASSLFEDVKRFLALCASTPQSLAPTREIDVGWHAFILFTNDYDAFCRGYCGRFIHHQPDDPAQAGGSTEAGRRTRVFAREVFGELSANWGCEGEAATADCTHCATCQSPCQAPCGSDGND
jgi:hypothetical protein